MTYTLYISRSCPYCIKVMDYCNERQIGCHIIDIDDKPSASKQIYVVPALFRNEDLMAYGSDIISYLEKVA